MYKKFLRVFFVCCFIIIFLEKYFWRFLSKDGGMKLDYRIFFLVFSEKIVAF